MFRLAYVCGCAWDATSLYRAIGPFQGLAKTLEGKVSFTELKEISWHTLGFYDGFFMQRPYSSTHVEVLNKVKKLGFPIWLDYDDDLLSVPIENPAHETYSDPEITKNFLTCLSLATIVTVSTQTLFDKFKNVCSVLKNPPQFVLIPNAFNDFLFQKKDKSKIEKEKIIMWRGSTTHLGDLTEIKASVKEVHKKFPDYTWLFIGQKPLMFKDVIAPTRLLHVKSQEPIDYMDLLNNIAPEIAMVPLTISPFNRAKSDIAWQEATLAGAITLAPIELPEFNKPGIFNYKKEEGNSFVDAMTIVINSSEEFKKTSVEKSWNYIDKNLRLSKINKMREEIIKGFL